MDIESCSISTSVDVEKNEKALTFAAPHRFEEVRYAYKLCTSARRPHKLSLFL